MCKTLKLGLLAFAVLGITFLGCDKLNAPNTPDSPGKVTDEGFPYQTAIIAGQNQTAGQITVSADADNIYILYQTTGNWYLTEYHAHVTNSCDPYSFPVTKKGSPIPGQFDYKAPVDPPNQQVVVTIPWGDLWGEEELCFAAHCVVKEIVGGQVIQTQTGWGDGEDFPGNNWGMYFCPPPGRQRKLIRIPWEHVHVQFIEVVGQTPTKWLLSDVPVAAPGDPPYNVANGVYRGFCLDRAFYVTGQQYWAVLYNPYIPIMPQYMLYLRPPNEATPTPWDLICWLADHFMDNEMPNPDAGDIARYQHVFWHLRGLYDAGSFTLDEQALHDEMEANGHDYYPMVGDWFAVPMDINCMTQLNFIIVDP